MKHNAFERFTHKYSLFINILIVFKVCFNGKAFNIVFKFGNNSWGYHVFPFFFLPESTLIKKSLSLGKA